MSLARYLPLDWRRRQWLRRTPKGPLHDYLSHAFVDTHQDYRQVSFVAIDLETTGLDPQRDHILSVGTVEINADAIDLGTAHHTVVSSDRTLNEDSVAIHQLTDDMVANGEPITEVITCLLTQLAGKVLLAHHAAIEVGFLRHSILRLFASDFLIPVVDTLALAQRQISRRNEIVNAGALRLAALREHYNLPRYKAHNALSDAVAAAELFLAQAAERRGAQQNLPLKQLLLRI